MKFTNLILSFYFIVLACMPCVDEKVEDSHDQQTASQTQDHSHETGSDACSPFCICGCCGVHVINLTEAVAYNFNFVSIKIETPVPSYKSVLASNFYGSIWQPPQIV